MCSELRTALVDMVFLRYNQDQFLQYVKEPPSKALLPGVPKEGLPHAVWLRYWEEAKAEADRRRK
jgi:hypothetical protein